MLETPVAFFIFNRPDTTRAVFAEIAKAKPQKLLVVADGPRADHHGEAQRCAAARAIIDRVDWDCDVLTNYSEVNLGCKKRVSSGLNWVFEIAEEAIILEDDCLPDQTFFLFCEELLKRYRDDERVMMISGTNFLGTWKSDTESYHFSYLSGIWGWASWRRAWAFYDDEIKLWPGIVETRFLEDLLPNAKYCSTWKKIFQLVYEGKLDTWDYQWVLACWVRSGFRISPAVNLISNIGWRPDATHTFGESPLSNIPTKQMAFPLKHPYSMIRDVEADDLILEMSYGLDTGGSIFSKLSAKLSRNLRHFISSW